MIRESDPILVVTRHKALVEYLKEVGIIGPQVAYKMLPEQVEAGDVAGKDVVGVLPLHLVWTTRSFTYVSVVNPHGKEMSIEDIRVNVKSINRVYARHEALPVSKGRVYEFNRVVPAYYDAHLFFMVNGSINRYDPSNPASVPFGAVIMHQSAEGFGIDLANDLRVVRYIYTLSLPKHIDAVCLIPETSLNQALGSLMGRSLSTWDECADALSVNVESLKRAWDFHRRTVNELGTK